MAAAVGLGFLACWVMFALHDRLTRPQALPERRNVTFDFVVTDAGTGAPVPNATVGIDLMDGNMTRDRPLIQARTDSAGRASLTYPFPTNLYRAGDGRMKGWVLLYEQLVGSYQYVVQADGYQERGSFLTPTQRIDFADTAPKPLPVALVPTAPPPPDVEP